jgi:hypothetical protein
MTDTPNTTPITEVKIVNPLLERIQIPGQTFRLPSGGLFYTDGELSPDVTNGEIHIFPLTALDEIVIRNPDKILNGKAICEVFARCIPDIKKPEMLFSKDVDFLLMTLRRVSYGQFIDLNYTHNCKDAKEHTYKVDLDPFIDQSKAIDPSSVNTLYVIAMPNGQKVSIKPIRFIHTVNIMQSAQYDTSNMVDLQKQLFDIMATVIDSVDEVKDSDQIYEWVCKIPRDWFKLISDAIDKSSDWGPKGVHKTKCPDCQADLELDVPLNPIVFFT